MDLNTILSRFITPQGLALPDELTLPAMAEMLYQLDAASGNAEKEVMRFWDYSEGSTAEVVTYTRQQVNNRIKTVAARLGQTATLGSRVAILMGNSPDYVFGFLGSLYAGMTPVPLYDPTEPGHADHLAAVLGDCKPAVVLTNGRSAGAVRRSFADRPAAQRPRIVSVDALPDSLGQAWENPLETPAGQQFLQQLVASGTAPLDQLAFLQYTSGSTRTPAGVFLTHRSMLTNAIQIYGAVEFQQPARIVSWLPMHHDMGIILAVMFTVLGMEVEVMRPRDFLQRPTRWLERLEPTKDDEHIYTAVPNFALDLAARAVAADPEAHYDLSHVEGVWVGSEAVTPATVSSFVETFEKHNLQPGRVQPGYGLAEATLLVTVPQTGIHPIMTDVKRSALSQDRIERAEQGHTPDNDGDVVRLVACGEVVQPQQLMIVDPETREELDDEHIGELWVYGDNIAGGYLDRPEDTQETFVNTLAKRREENSRAAGAPEDATWLATGDLGAFIDGQIYITGRRKDLIVIAGRNHYPADVEYTVDHATDHVIPGAVAAFAIPGDNSEQLVILAERQPEKDPSDDKQAIIAIKAAVAQKHGVAPSVVEIYEPGTIARSSAGKIARRVNRKKFLEQE